MDGTVPYNNFTVTTSAYPTFQQLNHNWVSSQDQTPIVITKCKCPNPKHTNGCSIEPESEYCLWCAKGCVKRVQAIHVRYT